MKSEVRSQKSEVRSQKSEVEFIVGDSHHQLKLGRCLLYFGRIASLLRRDQQQSNNMLSRTS